MVDAGELRERARELKETDIAGAHELSGTPCQRVLEHPERDGEERQGQERPGGLYGR